MQVRHLPKDLLARGSPRLLIAAVDKQVWPFVHIRVRMLQGSQATQESSGTPSRTKTADKVKNFLQAGPIGPGGGRERPGGGKELLNEECVLE